MTALRKELRIARKLAGLRQEDIAKLVGIDRTYYSAIERGRRTPALGVAQRIAAVLKKDVNDIFLPPDATDGHEISAEIRPEV